MVEFKLDLKSGVPFHRQIVDQIRYGIASDRLLPGEQLPTVRELAVHLQVNPNTVRKAYSELEILGILDTQQGTGTFIGSVNIQIPTSERQNKLESICSEYVSIASSYGFSAEEMIGELKKRQRGKR